jgi:anti-sigma factor ChrR (cupin superfamily)
MAESGGYTIVRKADIAWEDRKNVDGWPSRAGMYYDDRENGLCMRLIDYPVGSVEPRHTHPGAHATTLLKHSAVVDGIKLKPLDVVLGPSNEPHGPLDYRDSCQLFSVFSGSFFHSEVETLAAEKHYRLIQADTIAWNAVGNGIEEKTLVDRGVGKVLLKAVRFAAGTEFNHPAIVCALIAFGGAEVGSEKLDEWDFIYAKRGAEHAPIRFPNGATLLIVALQ